MITFCAGRIKKSNLTEIEHFCLISSQDFNESAKRFCEKVVDAVAFLFLCEMTLF